MVACVGLNCVFAVCEVKDTNIIFSGQFLFATHGCVFLLISLLASSLPPPPSPHWFVCLGGCLPAHVSGCRETLQSGLFCFSPICDIEPALSQIEINIFLKTPIKNNTTAAVSACERQPACTSQSLKCNNCKSHIAPLTDIYIV